MRYYLALRMAEKGLVSAPNAAVGEPFFVGSAFPGLSLAGSAPAASVPSVPATGSTAYQSPAARWRPDGS